MFLQHSFISETFMPVSLLQPCTDILSKSKIGGTTYGITAAEGMDKSSAKG